MFNSITYKELGSTVAQINRFTGDLYINPRIWNNLPEDYKHVILLHEHGHFTLQTPSEFEANQYAISNYLNEGELSDHEFNRRITVLSEILSKKSKINQMNHISNADPVTIGMISQGIGSVFSALPGMGIGSKSRIKEIQATGNVLQAQAEAQAKAKQTYIVIAGVIGLILIISLVLYFKLRKK